ncbi:thrombospondin type 3 repeat-containing protein [Candidatus Woesearchaeota archaeon]|nr:thrombospondin type 3 repeat-containing protein [Candidatus Woesearchaeota archaeon]
MLPILESAIVFAEEPGQTPKTAKVTDIEIYPPNTNLLTSDVVPETLSEDDIKLVPGKSKDVLNDCKGLFKKDESGCCINPSDAAQNNCDLTTTQTSEQGVSEEGTYLAKIKYEYDITKKDLTGKDHIETSALLPAHSVNWDANKDQCIKKMGDNEPEINWYEQATAGNKCCGDDVVKKNGQNDCGVLPKPDTVCLNHEDNPLPNSKEGSWKWYNADDELNSIVYSSCGDFEVLAKQETDAQKWITCGEASTSSGYNEEEFRYSVYRQITDTATGTKVPVKNTILLYLPVQEDGFGNLEFLLLQKFLSDHGYNILLFDRLTSPSPNKLNEIDLSFYSQLWVLNAERLDHTLPKEEIDAIAGYRNLGGSILLASGGYYVVSYLSSSPPSYNQRGSSPGSPTAASRNIHSSAIFTSGLEGAESGLIIGAAIGSIIPVAGTLVGAVIGAVVGYVVYALLAAADVWGKKFINFVNKVFGGQKKQRPKQLLYYIPFHYISIVNQISKALNLGVEFNKENVMLGNNEKTAPSSFGDVIDHPIWTNGNAIYMNSQAASLKKLDEDDFKVQIIGQQDIKEGTAVNFLAVREDEFGKVLFDTDLVKYMFAIGNEDTVGDTDTFILNAANWLEDRSRGPFSINSSYPLITLNAPDKKFTAPTTGEYVLESNNPNVEIKFKTPTEEKSSVTSADGPVDIIAKLKPIAAGSEFNGEKFTTPIIDIQPVDTEDPETAPIHQVLCRGNNGQGSIVECCGARNSPCFTTADNSKLNQKRFGESVSLYIKNPEFNLYDPNNKANVFYWHNSSLPVKEIYEKLKGKRKVSSKITVETLPTGGSGEYVANNVILMNYSGGKVNDYPGIYIYSDLFSVPGNINSLTDFSFYYKTVMPKKFSSRVKAQIFWYANADNAAVDITHPPAIPLTNLVEITDNVNWTKYVGKITKTAGYARIVLFVEEYNTGGTGTAFFDKFALGEPYYCVPGPNDDTLWQNDLDSTNRQACENAGDKEFGYGFKWTGKKCCGDKANEFYNDLVGKEAGCWNNIKVANGSLVANDARVLNYNGKFYSCNVKEGDELFDILNTNNPTGTEKLIQETVTPPAPPDNVGNCKTFNSVNNLGSAQGYYCSPNGANGQSAWKNDAVKDMDVPESVRIPYNRTKLSSAAQGMFALVRNECCPPASCWNGTDCMHDQTAMPWEGPTSNYRCVEDETGSVDWRVPVKKLAWDGVQEGYCPTDSGCLVPDQNTVPSPRRLKCIKSGEYTENHYCDGGKWSTRTRLVAQALLNYTLDNSPDEFTLYCDEFENVISDADSNPEFIGDATVRDFFLNAGADHACTLKTKDKILFGTAADVQIDTLLFTLNPLIPSTIAGRYRFISLFSSSPDLCKDAILNDGKFTNCGTSNLWINNKTMLVIYSKDDISNFRQTPIGLKILEFLINPLQATINFIRNIIKPKVLAANINLDIVKEPKDFTRFYFAKRRADNKDLIVRGVIESQANKDTLVLEYEGFKTDLCQRAVEAYDDKKINKITVNDPLAITDDIQCYPVVNDTNLIYRVIMQKDSAEGIKKEFWQDLTSKLRLENYAPVTDTGTDPIAEILLPAGTYKVSELEQPGANSGLRLTAEDNDEVVSYYWNPNTLTGYAGKFGNADDIRFNKTFSLSTLYGEARKVSGAYNVSLIVIGKDGRFSFNSTQILFESILGDGVRPGCMKRLGDANDDGIVNLVDYPLLREIAHNCIASYNPVIVSGAQIGGTSYDNMDQTCVCADLDQNNKLEFGDKRKPYTVDAASDSSKQDDTEFVEVCGKQECDADNDGYIDLENIDNCVGIYNPKQEDSDRERDVLPGADTIVLSSVSFPTEIRLLKIERSIGDACDKCTDPDKDGYGNHGFDISGCELSQTAYDNCHEDNNPDQKDFDKDGIGDLCDNDKDGDGIENIKDATLVYGDCSLENSGNCNVLEEFNPESGCCEARNLFKQANAEIKNSCLPTEIAVLCLSSESNAHGATVLSTPANTCPAGYKPICYPKAPGTGLTSNVCGIQNSIVAFKLSAITNAHAANELYTGSGYDTKICVRSEYGQMTCTYAERCLTNEFCLVTLSPDNNNLHLAACDSSEDSKAYSQKVCCSLGNQMRKTCLTRADQSAPCTRVCGDGIRQEPNEEGINEICDGKDLGGKTLCSQLDTSYVSGQLKCTSSCGYDTSGCVTQEQLERLQELPTSPKCGNNKAEREYNEECDGRNLLKERCTELLNSKGRSVYTGGKLKCQGKEDPNPCKYDVSGCYGNCGNGRIDDTEQCDPSLDTNFDYTCYQKTVPPKRSWGFIRRCSAVCEYDMSGCKPIIGEKDTNRKCVVNGKLEWWNGEECDGILLGNTGCQEQGYGAGSLGCNGNCQYDFSRCGAPLGNTCGNGIVEPHEYCDKGTGSGPVFRNSILGVPETCVQYDYGTGSLRCNDDCTINLDGCDDSSLLCGNAVINPAEDCDPNANPKFRPGALCSTLGLGFTSTDPAKLGCTDRCEFDPTRCT